jgi:putative heme-binding domain-containing protein
VIHAVSGADFGWRGGALKIPDSAPDAWPIVRAMGLGSPTAVAFAPAARFPAVYQTALWVADWSYGKLFALRLAPKGASFSATPEEIVSGLPLPITAVCVNPVDGALYFTTGGRRLPSALYRVRWIGDKPSGQPTIPAPSPERRTRITLEAYHGRRDDDAVMASWPALADVDPSIRAAARTAVESQPIERWRQRALDETAPRAALAALLALARADAPASQTALLAALRKLHAANLGVGLRREWVRVLSLTFSRGGAVDPAVRASWGALLGELFPSTDRELDPALLELLVFCEAPGTAAKGIFALQHAVTRQEQLDLAKSLRVLRTDWTPELRRQYFEWLAQTFSWRGGGTFARFLQRIRDDSVSAAPELERAALRRLLAAAAKKIVAPDYRLGSDRRVVREWTTDDLTALAQNDPSKHEPAKGRRIFGAVGCFCCHSFDGEGGALGPDLTMVARRMAVRDLFEAIVEPSRAISDQYGTVDVRTRDGRQLTGRIVNLTEAGLNLAENLAEPSNVIRLPEKDIATIEPSPRSLMPPGLLNVLSDEEILDLLAFMQTPPSR